MLLGLISSPPRVREKEESTANPISVDESGEARWLFHWWFFGFMIFLLVGAHELYANAWNLHIVNPIAATLAGRGIIVIATFTAGMAQSFLTVIPRKLLLKVPVLIAISLLLILNVFGQRALKNMYEPPNWYAEQSYKLGVALHQISQPNDLVVTLAHALGDPIAIYYSHRRGWVFTLGDGPEYPEGKEDDTALPKDDRISIQMIESLRKNGATWLGIVGVQQNKIDKEHPLLLRYLKEKSQLKQSTPEWTIYRFISAK